MLTQKLLRLEDNLIKEIEELATKLSEKKYTSFSALTRQLLRIGMDNMKSNINSHKMKQTVVEAVEKALDECASQHNANIDNLNDGSKIVNGQLKKLKLTFSFYWDNDESDPYTVKRPDMFCQPVIDLEEANNDIED